MARRWMTKLTVLMALMAPSTVTSGATGASGVLDVNVIFREVANESQTSKSPCTADGGLYDVAGRLVAPASGASGVTLYIPGSTVGMGNWFIEGLRGLDNARAMARDGHASVFIDRLGLGGSGRPNGHEVCVGAHASVAHQIVERLRRGDYLRADGGRAMPFSSVALAGNSLGSLVAEIEAYSYNDVDALLLTGFGSVLAAEQAADVLLRVGPRIPQECQDDEDGYFFQWATPQEEASDVFHDPDPSVVNEFLSTVEEESCATQQGVVPGLAQGAALASTIDVPVLIMNGEHDCFFDPAVTDLTRFRYPSSPDVDAVVIPDAGHAFMIERTEVAAAFRAIAGPWLAKRGL